MIMEGVKRSSNEEELSTIREEVVQPGNTLLEKTVDGKPVFNHDDEDTVTGRKNILINEISATHEALKQTRKKGTVNRRVNKVYFNISTFRLNQSIWSQQHNDFV